MTEVSSPPEYASTTFFTSFAIAGPAARACLAAWFRRCAAERQEPCPHDALQAGDGLINVAREGRGQLMGSFARLVSAAALAIVVLAGQPGAQTLPQYADAQHLGNTICTTCHGAAQPFPNSTVLQTEFNIWR